MLASSEQADGALWHPRADHCDIVLVGRTVVREEGSPRQAVAQSGLSPTLWPPLPMPGGPTQLSQRAMDRQVKFISVRPR